MKEKLLEKAGLFAQFEKYFTDPSVWTHIVFVVIKIVLIYIGGVIIIKLMNKAVQHMVRDRQRRFMNMNHRRTKTIGRLIGNVVKYAVYFIVFLLMLNQIGVNLAPLLAGAGVVGLAIGFGAQSLVKDVITGFFIIFEDQFAVGDVIEAGKYKGTVEEIGLRTTRIKSWTGEVHILPNGSITDVTNFSINNSVAVVDISIAYEEDVEKAIEALKEVAVKVNETSDEIVSPPNVLGVQTLGASNIVLRITAECRSNTQALVVRRFNQEIKAAFDRLHIEMPYPRLVTYHRTEKAES